MKKKRLKDEKLEKEYPEVRSDFSLEVVDKTLVNMFKVLLLRKTIYLICKEELYEKYNNSDFITLRDYNF